MNMTTGAYVKGDSKVNLTCVLKTTIFNSCSWLKRGRKPSTTCKGHRDNKQVYPSATGTPVPHVHPSSFSVLTDQMCSTININQRIMTAEFLYISPFFVPSPFFLVFPSILEVPLVMIMRLWNRDGLKSLNFGHIRSDVLGKGWVFQEWIHFSYLYP